MKIVSNFKDFYDGCSYYCGENTVYERYLNNGKWVNEPNHSSMIWQYDRKILEKSSKIFKQYLKKYNDYADKSSFSENLIFIGDKIVPFILKKDRESFSKTFYFEYNENMLGKKSFFNKNIKLFFKKDFNDVYKKVREIHKDVIVLYINTTICGNSDNELIQSGTNLNPKLKLINLSKIIEPYEVIQEIEMYLNKEKDIETVFTNEEKLVQAGFDSNSFKN